MDAIRYPIGLFEPDHSISAVGRQRIIDQIPNLVATLRSLTEVLTEEQLGCSYRHGGWSIRQIIHHMSDNDMNAYLRFKRALTEDEPMGSSYREDLFAEMRDYSELPIDNSLLLLEALHGRFVTLLHGLSDEHFQRKLKTQVLGSITLDIALQRFVWHDRHHIAQIEAAIRRYGQ